MFRPSKVTIVVFLLALRLGEACIDFWPVKASAPIIMKTGKIPGYCQKMALSLFTMKVNKCLHLKAETRHLSYFPHRLTLWDVFLSYHLPKSAEHKIWDTRSVIFWPKLSNEKNFMPVNPCITVGVVNTFRVNSIIFTCKLPGPSILEKAAHEATILKTALVLWRTRI